MLRFVSDALATHADPERAVAMAAYMKTDMPFYGVTKPQRVPIRREILRRFPVTSQHGYRSAVLALWRQPHREEKYLAIDLAAAYPAYITLESLAMYRTMVVEGAWWDLVDGIAADLVGRVARVRRTETMPVLDRWIDDEDMWLRRTAILAQLRHKQETDETRLFAYCLARADEREFFIRKAIGWALREYARTAPDAVRRFVLANRGAWSGLTYREATKHLDVPPR